MAGKEVRSDSRSDSRDSGLGKDSEGDHHNADGRGRRKTPPTLTREDSGLHTPTSTTPTSITATNGCQAERTSPPSPGSSLGSSGGSAQGQGRDRLNPASAQSQTHADRDRSRSPQNRDSDKTSQDKYSNYDRHFKKKFFGKEHRLKSQKSEQKEKGPDKIPPQVPREGSGLGAEGERHGGV